MSWQDLLKERQKIIFATSSREGWPNAIVVLSCGFVDNKLIVANCQMKTTLENVKSNPNVCIVANNGKEYYRIKGIAVLYPNGKFFNAAVERSSPTPPVKSAIVIDIKEVFDLDKGEKIL